VVGARARGHHLMADRPFKPIPIDGKLFLNVDETGLEQATAALENAFQNEAGGFSRFPGLVEFADLAGDVGDDGRCYGVEYNGDMIVATSRGNLYRIDKNANIENVTAAPISGVSSGRRAIFVEREDGLAICGGGQIISFKGDKTRLLSPDSPLTTHIGQVDGYLIALELNSGRFVHTAPDTETFDPLDTFAADGSPDDITALIVTPFRELFLCGPESIEQFERLTSGEVPFFRRWSIAEGLLEPFALGFVDNGLVMVNKQKELVRVSGQVSAPVSGDIQAVLHSIDDWSEAWIGGYPADPLSVAGQSFMMLQIPNATNVYGTKGYTFVLDVRRNRWLTLYGWDQRKAKPVRWPGWSHWTNWNKTYVGGEGKVYLLDPAAYSWAGTMQRVLLRTGHISSFGEGSIDKLRMRVKRGVGTYTVEPEILVRVIWDGKKPTKWVRRGLGKSGQRELFVEWGRFGSGLTFQIEIAVLAAFEVEVSALGVQHSPMGH
jgi:hypothetical protein